MSKQFKGKVCVYCGKVAGTGDHVFARAFFLEKHRANLPKVPACLVCNGRKAELETELSAIMPFGGRQADSLETLNTLVPPRLAANARLHRQIRNGKADLWTRQPSGLVLRGMTVPFPGEKLVELFEFIVRGVHAFDFKTVLDPETFVEVSPLTIPELRSAYRVMLTWNGSDRVHSQLGEGTFEYQGILGTDNRQISVWAFEMFGGMQIADAETRKTQRLIIGAMTGPRHIEENATRIAKWRRGHPQ